MEALQRALATGRRPETFNTDQGSQFTSEVFTERLTQHGIAISMDGVGRAFDGAEVCLFVGGNGNKTGVPIAGGCTKALLAAQNGDPAALFGADGACAETCLGLYMSYS